MASEYLQNEWIPKNKNIVYNYLPPHRFEIKKEDKNYRMANVSSNGLESSYTLGYWIEVYKVTDIEKDPEMCFYIPLK